MFPGIFPPEGSQNLPQTLRGDITRRGFNKPHLSPNPRRCSVLCYQPHHINSQEWGWSPHETKRQFRREHNHPQWGEACALSLNLILYPIKLVSWHESAICGHFPKTGTGIEKVTTKFQRKSIKLWF